MAEETPNETPDAVEETAVDATPTGDAPAAEAEVEATPAPEPVTPLTPKERKAAARARRGKRRGATPEERDAARKAKAASRSRYRAKQREKKAADTTERTGTPPREHGEGAPKVRTGTVVSDRADKTITVRIDTARRHRKYEKIVRSSSTLHAHDEENTAGIGDLVKVVESRPMSRTKRWKLVEVMERAK